MKRGEVWWVRFDPAVAAEIRKTRPAVIISNDVANQNLNRVQVVPVTSKADKLYPPEAHVSVRGQMSKAMADQITTVSKRRLSQKIAVLSPEDMADVNLLLGFSLD